MTSNEVMVTSSSVNDFASDPILNAIDTVQNEHVRVEKSADLAKTASGSRMIVARPWVYSILSETVGLVQDPNFESYSAT